MGESFQSSHPPVFSSNRPLSLLTRFPHNPRLLIFIRRNHRHKQLLTELLCEDVVDFRGDHAPF